LEIHSLLVDQNVLKIQIVQEIEYARIKNVLIPAQDFVASMLFAQLQIMYQAVIVFKVTLVTLQWLVTQYQLSQLLLRNPVTQIAVVYTVTSEMSEVPVYATAYQVMLEIPQIVDLSVLLTQNVNKTMLVSTKSVNHLVELESVVKMQNVM
jgi:hypothetical protein